MNLDMVAYVHGSSMDDITLVNLFFLSNCKTICSAHFTTSGCIATVYDLSKQDDIAIGLYEIFGFLVNFELDKSGEYALKGECFLERAIEFIKNNKIRYNFDEIGKLPKKMKIH